MTGITDTDIFGSASETPNPGIKDADIFKAPAQPKQAPGSKAMDKSGWDYLKQYFKDTLEGAATSPLGPVMGAAIGSSKIANEALDRLAYKAGEKATDVATAAGASPETAAKVGYGANVLTQAVPVVAGGELAKLGSPAMTAGAKDLMAQALKPTWQAWRKGEAAKAIDTMLDEGFTVSKSSIGEMRAKIDTLENQVSDALKNSNAMINKAAVGQRLRDTFDRFRNQVNPQSDLDSIKSAWDQFKNHPDLIGKTAMPVQQAQKMKQGTYRALSDKYGEEGSAATEAQKDLARGLKEEISAAVPVVSEANARASNLINAMNIAQRRAMMGSNNNVLGLGPMATTPGGFAAFLADRSSWLKSLAALAMYSGRDPSTLANIGRAGIGYYELPQGNAEGNRPVLDMTGILYR